MKYPKTVRIAKQDVIVQLGSEELNEDGELVTGEEQKLKCNLQLNAYEKLTADKRLITLSGRAYFDGDIAPGQTTISSGKLTFEGDTYNIHKGKKNYNPDGTVNNTELELI